jgi:hypothetical protein
MWALIVRGPADGANVLDDRSIVAACWAGPRASAPSRETTALTAETLA